MQSSVLRQGTASCSGLVHRPACAPFLGRAGIYRPPQVLLPQAPNASSSAAFDASSGGQAQEPQTVDGANLDYKPFSRRKERNPHKLLGISEECDFEEVVDARNYLVELYKWHEESRESVELAFDTIIQQKYKGRFKEGFRPPRRGGKGVTVNIPRPSPFSRISEFVDTSISLVGLINEGLAYAAMAVWAMFSVDQSFPLAGAFAYSVYKFQAKRVKADPDAQGTPIIGALLTTIVTLGIACGVMAAVTVPLGKLVGPQLPQVNACITILIMGVFGVYLK